MLDAVATIILAGMMFIPIINLVVIAALLSFILAPVIRFLRGLGIWRTPAVIITVLAALGILAGLDVPRPSGLRTSPGGCHSAGGFHFKAWQSTASPQNIRPTSRSALDTLRVIR